MNTRVRALLPLSLLLFALIGDLDAFEDDTLDENPTADWYTFTDGRVGTGSGPYATIVDDADCDDGQCLAITPIDWANIHTSNGFDACRVDSDAETAANIRFRTPTGADTSDRVILGFSDGLDRNGLTPPTAEASPYGYAVSDAEYFTVNFRGNGFINPPTILIAGRAENIDESPVTDEHATDTALTWGTWYYAQVSSFCDESAFHLTVTIRLTDSDGAEVDSYFYECLASCPEYTHSLGTAHLGIDETHGNAGSDGMRYDALDLPAMGPVTIGPDRISAPMARDPAGIAANYAYNATVYTRDRGNDDGATGLLYKWNNELASLGDESPCDDAGGRVSRDYLEPIAYASGNVLVTCQDASGNRAFVWVNATTNAINDVNGESALLNNLAYDHVVATRPYEAYGYTAQCGGTGFCTTGTERHEYRGETGAATVGGVSAGQDLVDFTVDRFAHRYYGRATFDNDDGQYLTNQVALTPGATSNNPCGPGEGTSAQQTSALRIRENTMYTVAQDDVGMLLAKWEICGDGGATTHSFNNITGDFPGHGVSRTEMEISPDGHYLVLQTQNDVLGAVFTLYDTAEFGPCCTLLDFPPIAQFATDDVSGISDSNAPMAIDSANNYLYAVLENGSVYRFPMFSVTVSTGGDGATPDDPNPPADEDEVPEEEVPIGGGNGGGPSATNPVVGDGVVGDAVDFCSERWGIDCAPLFGLTIVAMLAFIFAVVGGGAGLVLGATLGFIIAFLIGLFPLWALLLFVFVAAVLFGALFYGGRGDGA